MCVCVRVCVCVFLGTSTDNDLRVITQPQPTFVTSWTWAVKMSNKTKTQIHLSQNCGALLTNRNRHDAEAEPENFEFPSHAKCKNRKFQNLARTQSVHENLLNRRFPRVGVDSIGSKSPRPGASYYKEHKALKQLFSQHFNHDEHNNLPGVP